MKSSPLLLAVLLALPLGAQTVVRRPGNTAADALRATIARLVDGKNATEAHVQLLRSGAAAVSLLAAEVERDGPAANAALFVLVELGCEAAPAVPVLRRAAAAEATTADRRGDLERAIAAIDGPPMLLVPVYQENVVIEYDLDGVERRRVAFDNPWLAWPSGDDRVAAFCYGHGRIDRRSWDGKELVRREIGATSAWCLEIGADDVIRTDFQGRGTFERLDAKNEPRWRLECQAVRVHPLVDGRLMAFGREGREVWSYAGTEKVSAVELPGDCTGVRPLPGGGYLVCVEGKVLELDPAGVQLREWSVGGRTHDAVLLRDGRLAVSAHGSVTLLAPDGAVVWTREHKMCGPLFVREPASSGR